MTTTRQQLRTTRARRRLFQFAGDLLAADIGTGDGPENIDLLAYVYATRLNRVGVRGATVFALQTYASSADIVDGLQTGRYDLARFVDPDGPGVTGNYDRALEGLIDACESAADYTAELASLLGP